MSDNPIILTAVDHERLSTLIYEYTNHRLGMDGRALKALARELDRARIVAPEALPYDVVTMDTEVNVLDLDRGEVMRMRVCWPERSDPLRGYISVLAPLGLALLGTREGDEVEWPVPDGWRRLRVEKVLFQPEAAAQPSPGPEAA